MMLLLELVLGRLKQLKLVKFGTMKKEGRIKLCESSFRRKKGGFGQPDKLASWMVKVFGFFYLAEAHSIKLFLIE